MMKKKAICIGIMTLGAIVMFFATSYMDWDTQRMVYSALYSNISVVVSCIVCLFCFNKDDMKATGKAIAVSFATYIQLLVVLFVYQYGEGYVWFLFLIQIFLHRIIEKSAPNLNSLVVMYFIFMVSTIWANRICEFMYYSNTGHDMNAITGYSLGTMMGLMMVLTMSIFEILGYDRDYESGW